MLVGDGRQAIYPGGFRLSHLGLHVAGRSFRLDVNWRNTQRIADAAAASLGDAVFDDLDDGRSRRARDDSPLPLRVGEPPQLHIVEGAQDGREVMLMLVEEALRVAQPADIGVLGRTKKALDWAERALRDARHPVVRLDRYRGDVIDAIRVGTFAKSKGLEFKLAILVGVGKAGWAVNPFWLREAADIEGWWATELRTFYVALTRARDSLAVLSRPELAPPIERAREHFDEWDWR
jgi:ATP-dependent exoDNAse (exonuclease V) beta subunit